MLHLLHTPEDTALVEEDILPLLKAKKYRPQKWPLAEEFTLEKDAVLMLFLPDACLRSIIPEAARNQWPVVILPHPENKFTSKGLGTSNAIEKVLKEYETYEEPQKLDLLFCNEIAVFSSVNVGDIFILSQNEGKKGILSEVANIIKNIRHASALSHHPYELAVDGEKLIHTSAMGIIVVEHASSSLISRRLMEESSLNDGCFEAFIIAPQNLLSLLWFFVRSLMPQTKPLPKLPSFIGKIRTSNLSICQKEEMEFTIDGEKYSAKDIHLEVQMHSVFLMQKSIFTEQETTDPNKNSLKIEQLPRGIARTELIRRKLPIFPRASAEQFQDLFKVLRINAEISTTFMVMMILSTLIATFGLFADSSPVIIGAMILAPIIGPIVSFAMGMVRYDVSMLKKGFVTITSGTLISLAFAAGVTLIIPMEILTSEIEARLSPTLLDMGIAVSSGIAAAYAHSRESIAKSLAGVAIAVALVPPLAVAGIGIGWWNWDVFSGAILLYATNLAGIILFAGLTFLILGFAPFKRARMGLVYTFIIVVLVTVPLSLSFNRIMQEANITRSLEGITIEKVVLRDVKIRFGKQIVVSARLVGPEGTTSDKIQNIKEKVEEIIQQPVVLEVVSALEY